MAESRHKQIVKLIQSLSGQSNVLTIPRVFIEITGEINAALLLSQCIYWSDKSNNNFGYFYKSYREWQDEIGLTQYQVKRAADLLVKRGMLKTIIRKAHGAPTTHYKIDFESLTNSIIKKLDNQETSQSDYQETQQSDYQETSQSLTETTHKTTQEITGKRAPSKSSLTEENFASANRMVDAILENAQKAKSSWRGRENIPEPIRDLLDVYVQITGQKPVKDQLMDWLASGNDWLEAGIIAEDLRNAFEKSKPDQNGRGGFLVNRPGSLTRTAQMFAGQRQTRNAGMTPIEQALAEVERMARHG